MVGDYAGVLGGGEMAREDESFATGFWIIRSTHARPSPGRRCLRALGGDHAAVEAWRRAAARERTASRRPDLWSNSMKRAKTTLDRCGRWAIISRLFRTHPAGRI